MAKRVADGIADDVQVGLRQCTGRLAADGLDLKIKRTRRLKRARQVKQRALGVIRVVLADVDDAHGLLPDWREMKLVVERRRVAPDGQPRDRLPGAFGRQLDHPAAPRRDVHLLAERIAGRRMRHELELIADAAGRVADAKRRRAAVGSPRHAGGDLLDAGVALFTIGNLLERHPDVGGPLVALHLVEAAALL